MKVSNRNADKLIENHLHQCLNFDIDANLAELVDKNTKSKAYNIPFAALYEFLDTVFIAHQEIIEIEGIRMKKFTKNQLEDAYSKLTSQLGKV